MKKSNIEEVRKSFQIQAENFESQSMSFSKADYLHYTVKSMGLTSQDSVLEVAAGTCACGRSIAPWVQNVTCLDATTAMLEVGKQKAQENHLKNMIFVKGYAEELPFLNESFDIVISRLAFHHFTDIQLPFAEMTRVLKPGGKLVLIDMEAAEERLRSMEDEIETLRDPSHVKNLSEAELLNLFSQNHLTITKCEKTRIPVSLEAWLELTQTPAATKEDIIGRMRAEIAGGDQTGFQPYIQKKEIYFEQRWLMIIGVKN